MKSCWFHKPLSARGFTIFGISLCCLSNENCNLHPEARVSVVQKHSDSDTVTVTITLSIRDSCVGMVEYEYASMLAVLDAFGIDEHVELWEVVEN